RLIDLAQEEPVHAVHELGGDVPLKRQWLRARQRWPVSRRDRRSEPGQAEEDDRPATRKECAVHEIPPRFDPRITRMGTNRKHELHGPYSCRFVCIRGLAPGE